MTIEDTIKKLATVDIFKEARKPELFVGHPFAIDYEKALILVADSWKMKVKGIPQGCFLLAFYENEEEVSEALLLRALRPTKLPTDTDVISSMIEYYKDDLKTSGKNAQLDPFTKYEFSFSGLECRILGTFYKDINQNIKFGADVENFYSAHNYDVYKPVGNVLGVIANLRDMEKPNSFENAVRIGKVRYSSSIRFQADSDEVEVYIEPEDFFGKRTALFGMTRTGKSNTVKKIIEATTKISEDVKKKLGPNEINNIKPEELLEPFNEDGLPKLPIGQIIFDINGEYANPNLQDEGTAIFEKFKDITKRYSTIKKEGFSVMKVNFYSELTAGFSLITEHFRNAKESSDYVNSFLSIDLEKPEDYDDDPSVKTRYDRKVAAYQCCLYKAGFKAPRSMDRIRFQGAKEINEMVKEGGLDPSRGISFSEAVNWFTKVWDNYREWPFLKEYNNKHGHEWADEELKAILVFLTQHKTPGSESIVSGYNKLKRLKDLHTSESEKSFEEEIVKDMTDGNIVIIDLSQGDTEVQKLYSERICTAIFRNSANKFIENKPNNFIQFYFEESHNLFPKKEDKDLSQIYNKIAKEGAKLNLGLIYATQEVSSISANILKNTQNWFIAHLNNEDELKEIKKYYDFSDFAESLLRFCANSDKGFVRMKTYSNPFVVPVQIDRFIKDAEQ